MNRPLKFRAWDKEKKEISDISVITWHEHNYNGEMNYVVCYPSLHTPPIEDVILMQFTGLLDRNGKEVFEGDIVKEELDNTYYWAIGYRDGAFVDLEGQTTLYEMNIEDGELTNLEVVGNIYSNPELLK